MYVDLDFDIQTRNGVMIEKFIAPTHDGSLLMTWCDKDEKLHSFNGMPAFIRLHESGQSAVFLWYKHGNKLKILEIRKKHPDEIIAEKIKFRTFVKRNRK